MARAMTVEPIIRFSLCPFLSPSLPRGKMARTCTSTLRKAIWPKTQSLEPRSKVTIPYFATSPPESPARARRMLDRMKRT
jgi:hypothetical protein